MLEVTRETLLYLKRTLQNQQAPPEVAMRLSRESDDLELFPDRQQPGDWRFALEQRTILVVDRILADELRGQRLNILEDPPGEAKLLLEPT